MAVKTCQVTCRDSLGVGHTVEVTAQTLFEAVAQALRLFRENDWTDDAQRVPDSVTVRVRQPVRAPVEKSLSEAAGLSGRFTEGFFHRRSQTAYELEVKNFQSHQLFKLLSRHYPQLCFVNSEICLDDGSVLSAFVRKGRCQIWELPEIRQDGHWRLGAGAHGMSLEQAYDDEEVRADAERGMLVEALDHWDNRVLKALKLR